MFGMAILTHGEQNGLLMANDFALYLHDFVDPIKYNPTLIGKPKVICILLDL